MPVRIRPREAGVRPTWIRTALLLVGSVALAACSGGEPTVPPPPDPPEPLPPGDHEFSLTHQGSDRFYLLHVPQAAEQGDPLPIVLALHGGGGNPDQFKPDSGFDDVADREGFLVAYPAGSGVLPRSLLTWNAGTDCCGYALEEGVDDVGFLLAVVADLASRTPVDRDRVYVSGHSNGGIMAYRIAAEAAEEVAAIAPVAGAMMLDAFDPARAVPVLHIHSVDDPRALYGGGLGPPFPIGGGRVLHRAVMDGLEQWVARNGCEEDPEVAETLEGDPGTGDEGHEAERLVWSPCTSGAPVVHWRLSGVGHGWPGRRLPPNREDVVGPSTTLLSAPEEAWSFFEGRALR